MLKVLLQIGGRLFLSKKDEKRQEGQRDQENVDERSGYDAPEDGSRTRRRTDKGHASQRPKHNGVRSAPHLPTRQSMTELVQEHDAEKGKIFQHTPNRPIIFTDRVLEYDQGHDEPSPMQVDVDARDRENSKGAGFHHVDLERN